MSERRDPARRDRLGPPPIEPLSDLSWARIERSVFAELDAATPASGPVRPARRWPVLVAMPLAAAAALVVWLAVRPDEPVQVGRSESPARLVTRDAPTELNFGDALITAHAQSTLVLDGTAESGVLIIVERGGARFDVSSREGRPPFLVEAGDVSVRVVGTNFVVARDGNSASVEVFQGTVEVVARGQRVYVEAGEAWSSETGWRAAAGDAAMPAPAVPAPKAPATDDTPPAAPTKTADSRPERRRDRRQSRAVEIDEDVDDGAPREPTSREQYEAAARLERMQPAAALERYRALARGSGPWAEIALFAAGRLAFDRGDAELAQTLLNRYLRRFPRGGNAADARALLDRM